MKVPSFLPKGLKARLIALVVTLGLVPMAILGVVAVRTASSAFGDEAQLRVDEIAFNASDKLDRNLFERYGDVQAFANGPQARSMDPRRIQTWMDTTMGIYTPIYNLMVVADANGRVVAANTVDLNAERIDSSPIIGTDVSKEAWFRTARDGKLKDAETLVEDLRRDPLTSAVYGEDSPQALAMSFTYPIKNDAGDIVGVWTNRFNWAVTGDILTAATKRAAEGGAATAKLYVLAKDGTILSSDTPSDTLARKLGEPSGDVLDGAFASAGFSTYPGVGWRVVATQERAEALASASSLRTLALILGLLAAGAIAALAFLLARSITRPIDELERASTAAAAGDLTVRTAITRDDEIGRLGHAFNAMVESLNGLVTRIHGVSDMLGASSARVADNSGAAGRATGEIADTVEGVARGAGEQAEATQGVTRTIDEMAGDIGRVTSGVSAVADAAGAADRVARDGAATVDQATEAMDRIERSVGSAADVVGGMGRKSEEIGGIVEAITQISDQTNLLALNAAIEAARAGEQGRGFAVVADEVRQLAEESSKAAGSIAEIVADIQREARRAVEAMSSGQAEVAEGAEKVGAAGSAFALIQEQVATLAGEVDEVARAAEGLGTAVDSVQEGIAAVAAVSEENAASAQEVAASTEEATASVEDVAASARELASAADELRGLVASFRIAGDATPAE